MKKSFLILFVAICFFGLIFDSAFCGTINNPMAEDFDGGGYKIFNISDLITSGPWVDARLYSSGVLDHNVIQAAINAIGISRKTLLIAGGSWDISGSLTIPSNINLRFEKGSFFNVVSGVTVDIRGNIDAGLYQIFAGNGNIELAHLVEAAIAPYVYPQWWGAVAGDTNEPAVMTQNTFALNQAIEYGKTFLSAGVYKVNGNIGNLYYGTIKGVSSSKTVIKSADTGLTIMGITGDGVVSDIAFDGGGRAINISTGNTDSISIKIENCKFENQYAASITDDGDSASTLTIIDNCKFVTSVSGYAIDMGSQTGVRLNDCFIHVLSNTAIKNRDNNMYITGLLGVSSNSTQNSCWIENSDGFNGSYLSIKGSRFEGKDGDGGRCLIKNYAEGKYATYEPFQVIVENSKIFVNNDHAFKFFGLPNKVVFKDNGPYSLSAGKGIYLDSGISSGSILNFPTYGYFENGDKLPIFGTEELTQLVSTKDYTNLSFSVTPLTTDMIFSKGIGDDIGSWGGGATATVTSVTFPYNGIAGRKCDATADGQYLYLIYEVPSTLFSENTLYVGMIDVINNSKNPKVIQVFLGDAKKEYVIGRGLHILSVPYFWSTGKSTAAKFAISNLLTGDSLQFGRYRIFKGNNTQKTVNTIIYGSVSSSVPNSSYIKFYKGDRLIHMDADVGGYIGRQCVTAGNPGVWNSFGVIVP